MNKSSFDFCLILVAVLVGLSGNSVGDAAEPWNRFHGVDGQGFVQDAVLPVSWTENDYRWQRDLGSYDVGSPIVHDGNVFYMLSLPTENKIAVQSVELRSGKVRWTRKFVQESHHLHRRNTYASSTPVADEDYVFVAWSEPEHTFLKCFDHDGKEIWSRDFGSWQSQHGFGTSPVIHGDMVLLFNSQQADQLKPGETAGSSRMTAVDRKTGKTRWETSLKTTRSCYGVPAVYERDGKTQIIDANTGNGMFGMDPESGRMLWNLNVFEMRCCSTPLIVGDLAIASSGSGGGGNHLVAVRIPHRSGDKPQQVYRVDRGAPYVPTPAVKGNRLFMVDDKGIASCVDAKSGEAIWSKRVGGNFSASPLVVGDRVLLVSLDGDAIVLSATDDYKVLGKFSLGGPVGASPAFVNGYLLLRVGERLVCLGGQSI
ncbi:MAG: PQQ-binding-like beta-propeller repeat protein [Rubripirellula sp.]|nr:PQQ-binding-like beta-propeller repeat protein [Rubripirellula sp.]